MNAAIKNTVSLFDEMVAYETLWAMPRASLKSIAAMFKEKRMLPSDLLEYESDMFEVPEIKEDVTRFLLKKSGFSICVNGAFQYPQRLREAKYPIELFYYKGDIGCLDSDCISVVGSRKCSADGMRRTEKLVKGLVDENFTIVSGLAKGIDTVALTTAINSGGRVIGVIGTPIDEFYPKENKELQEEIAGKHLLISQVPFYRYEKEPFTNKRHYFPQRNETMSALSLATIIVEASDTSGTLTQARACLDQGRKLFILNSCFERHDITWPLRYLERGAIRVKDFSDIYQNLKV